MRIRRYGKVPGWIVQKVISYTSRSITSSTIAPYVELIENYNVSSGSDSSSGEYVIAMTLGVTRAGFKFVARASSHQKHVVTLIRQNRSLPGAG